ncbi:MAG: putative DNA modification/repair radical SAM protein [Myxococcales bacterium]|nr:putative DNA modification/repair radical SAM protein [Myxococcales bacterium]
MDTDRKLEILGESASQDVAGATDRPECRRKDIGEFIYPAQLSGGRVLRQLKVLLDNACPFSCAYCAQRAGRDTPRTRFTPEELSRLFASLVERGAVDGLFLSSGIGRSPVATMDRMLATVEIIRRRYDFQGFVHLKILPGAEPAQIERAAELADRLSINLEAPSAAYLSRLSAQKDLPGDILRRMSWISTAVRARRARARSHTTQFVIGAGEESDREVLGAAWRLYRQYSLGRAYYSAFRPIPGTPLEDRPRAPLLRQHRLYQADFLLRHYGFSPHELVVEDSGNLAAGGDPKLLWACAHPELFPVEVNRAPRELLLRVPGFGERTVRRIIEARKIQPIRDLAELARLAPLAQKAAPFLLIRGKAARAQLDLGL